DIRIESADEHTLVFLLGNEEIGRIPVFIDAPQSLRSAGVVDEAMETALKKGSILWLTIPQPDGTTAHRPAWYVQQGQQLFVIKGGDEQELPHLENNNRVSMTVKSKDVQAAIAEVDAEVRVVDNDSEEFEKIATLGLGTRLNLPDGQGALERWKETCVMVELTPQV
ncbi:MAG: pyridoxamine 5'-phosphate oxidase family protein, partial [Nitriliruptorales bacterium]|nr:pyridoxamine 5'-phosphate oxidase family protein [Nitriliruptorales bacterium]